jgi:hypothetical protein
LLAISSSPLATTLHAQETWSDVAEALEFAAQADQRAENARDPVTRADSERQADYWRRLAESFEFGERLQQFLTVRKAKRPPGELRLGPSFGLARSKPRRIWRRPRPYYMIIQTA